MKVFTGNANPRLAGNIASYLGCELGGADIRQFPDGETFVKLLENVRGEDCFVIQSICGQPNERLMELLIMVDAMKRASAARITAFIPYFGYARQDRKDQPRVPITAKLVANLLTAAGTNRLLALDLHAQQIMGFFDIPVDHLYGSSVMVKYLRTKNLKSPVVVSPDTGGVKQAYAYSQMLGCGLAIVAKQRKGPTEVEAFSLVGEVKDCDVIMVDDLVTTCGTLSAAAKILEANGARNIYAAVTHGLVTEQGAERLRNSSIKELIVTDSVPQKSYDGVQLTVLSVAELIGEAIKRIYNNQSISSLFKL